MKVLLTGAFGNLGACTLEELLPQKKHNIRCFDIKNPRNEKEMKRLSALGQFETCWGDITDPDTAGKLVQDRDCILHLAAIIPPLSELQPELTKKVNVGGTHNLINAAKKTGRNPKFVFTSSITVHGNKYSTPPPRHAAEPPEPTDNYTHSKVASETELKASGLPWTILRIGVAMPLDLLDRDMKSSMATMFGIPLKQRLESVHPRDCATAVANSIEADTAGKILYLGGGKNCQMENKEFVKRMFDALGIGMPPENAFRVPKDDNDYWYTDYMDTEESQHLLKFQNNSFEDYIDEMKKMFGWKRPFTMMLSPIIRRVLASYSPYK